MNHEPAGRIDWARTWIPVGAGLFIVALTVSAAVVPALRLLHVLQALIYVAVVLLARRNKAAGFGAAVAVAIVWNSLNLFITHLMQAGAGEFWSLLLTGHVRRLDTMMVALGGAAHFLLIVACLAAFLRQRPGGKDWTRFGAGAAVALAYLAMIVIAAAPR